MDYEAVRQGLEQAIPFNRHVGLDVAEVGEGRGVVRLPDDERLHNHVGSQHAGALFSAGEAASGAAFVGAFAERMGGITPLARTAEISYLKLAHGPITATGTLGEGKSDAARAPRLRRQGRVPGRGRDDRRRRQHGRGDDRALARAQERVNATHTRAFPCHRGAHASVVALQTLCEVKAPRRFGVAAFAERQHGVVAHRQLIELGLQQRTIQRRIGAGLLHRVHRGVYAVGHRRLYNARAMDGGGAGMRPNGATEPRKRRSALRHPSHVRLSSRRGDGAPNAPQAVRASHFTCLAVSSPRIAPRNTAYRSLRIPSTLIDLAEIVQRRRLRRALEESERLGIFDLRAEERLIARSTGHRGLRQLKEVIRDYSGPPPITSSELERLFLDLCDEAGLPGHQVNILVEGYEVDDAWPENRLIVELDGYGFHRTRANFENDRVRDAVLQLAGYRVIRITHRRMQDAPAKIVRLLRALLSRWRERPGGAPRAGVRARRAGPAS